jgi:hypothetical protein
MTFPPWYHVWVCLPFLPLHCWNDETLRNIGNTLGKYIDRVEPRDGLQVCARLCVEVDLEKGFPEAIQLTLDNWSYIQQVDYEQLPFKCKSCHEYMDILQKIVRKINQISQKSVPKNNGNSQKGRRLQGR